MTIINRCCYRLEQLLTLIAQPRDKEDCLISQAANDDALWSEIGKMYLPRSLVLGRLDIKLSDWKSHLELYDADLCSGCMFVGRPIHNTNLVVGHPVLIYEGKLPISRWQAEMKSFELTNPEDVVYLEFYIRGLAPAAGSLGFVIKLQGLGRKEETAVFLCQNADQLSMAFDRLLDMAAKAVRCTCQNTLRNSEVKAIRLWTQTFTVTPTAEEIKLLLRKLLNMTVQISEFADTGELHLITRAIVAVNPLNLNQEYFRAHMTLAQLRF